MATQMMQKIAASGKLYPDPIVTEYVQSIGNRLFAASHSRKPLQFFVVNDDSINAFAGPAGYIGINAGLIMAADSESELASVIAHEIAHVSQGHLQQNLLAAKQANLGKIATMLAAIAVGFVNPAAATGALVLGTAGTEQHLLNFSRVHEFEADQIGIQTLEQANYDPEAMLKFFERLSQQERYYDRPPELLLTHPFTEERIAQAANRLQQMSSKHLRNPLEFYLVKERVRNAMSDKPYDLITYYQRLKNHGHYANQTAIDYGYALALLNSHRSAQAQKIIQKLIRQDPTNALYLLADGHIEFELNHDDASIEKYKQAHTQYPESFAIMYWYAKVLIDTKQAAKSVTLVEKYLRAHPDDIDAYNLLSHAQAENGQLAQAYQTRAKVFLHYDDYPEAIKELNVAKQQKGITSPEKTEIDAKIAAVNALANQKV